MDYVSGPPAAERVVVAFVASGAFVNDQGFQGIVHIPRMPLAVFFHIEVEIVTDSVLDFLKSHWRELPHHENQKIGGLRDVCRFCGFGFVVAMIAFVQVLQPLRLVVVS